ncbi:hypothetical protein OEA41_003980 [Lepraria neglecta]|uniref:DUF7137 domain-containing protein n=1 Tax=Lepraria neglecta TaxID=209136 RepID=A0AAE0DJH1_9LECA|nr:hypothetical protein OEA41_003980 [Lepraria neglecta]
MIQRLRLGRILLALFLWTSITAAWPWPPSFKDMGLEGLIVRRQDSTKSDTTSPTKTATGKATSATSKSAAASKTAAPASKTAKGSNTAAATTGAAASASGSGAKTSGKAAVTSVNNVLPPGGVNMITPSALAQSSYYKIGDYVTFAWNYTSLSIKPNKIDVVVTCADNSATYPLATNATFKPTDTVVWDTAPDETGTAPLLMGEYTLLIYDAGQGPTAAAQAGRLGTSDDIMFGMYIPQKPTPRSVCNAALSDTERQALKFMFGMCAVTILSFTWFVSGLF